MSAPTGTLFRSGLLAGVNVALVPGGSHAGELSGAVAGAAGALAASLVELALDGFEDEEERAGQTVRDAVGTRELDALVVDAADLFAGASAGIDGEAALAPLRNCLDRSWDVVRTVANATLIPQGRGKVVLLAPRMDAGPHASAARAGLENLARTLSIEWARYGITPTTIAPGPRTSPDEVAAITCYLVSQAGEFFSGCLLELGAV